MSEFGSSDPDFVFPLLNRIGKLGIKEKIWHPDIIKFAISFIRGIRPRDQVNALLGFHMVTIHRTIMVNYGRINQARFMQYNEEEEDAQRAVNRLVRTLIRLVDRFDRLQNGGELKFAFPNRHPLAKISQRPKRSADPATGAVDQTDISRIHRAAVSNTSEKDQVRNMEPIEHGEIGATVDAAAVRPIKLHLGQPRLARALYFVWPVRSESNFQLLLSRERERLLCGSVLRV